jgi:hypothetical protein
MDNKYSNAAELLEELVSYDDHLWDMFDQYEKDTSVAIDHRDIRRIISFLQYCNDHPHINQ